jgi:hypothetical protein
MKRDRLLMVWTSWRRGRRGSKARQGRGTIFMHCSPAARGQAGVIVCQRREEACYYRGFIEMRVWNYGWPDEEGKNIGKDRRDGTSVTVLSGRTATKR